ncbi:MAG: thrombospondin type 3 repeat-containing protein [Candidatus Poseidoniaceae archaeon]
MTRVFTFFVIAIFLLFPLSNSGSNFELEKENFDFSSDLNNEFSQFGTGFDETVVASSADGLSTPRDLEFHPSQTRNDELWIVNRADDSVVIIHNTGQSNQYSEKRLDAYRNHFLEEVSSIAFGSYDAEFDYQFATGQESRNTYNGQGSPNNFMGPALWPSSLSHFAVEHQNDGLLGSHTDMLHESPFGMGIAHDSGNAYWYFDGYYGNLVYYDFQEDHDTGMDDHSDGIVRRHTDIQLARVANIPGHMILDKNNGILYISDTGNNRVLWVNTLDTSILTTDMMNDNSRLEPLQEYSAITGREYGVLINGISNPSGIALDGDSLFISSNGNGSIWALELSANGKSGNVEAIVETQASSIMGLEIGPDSKLYYVDGQSNEVVRLDPYPDTDKDHIRNSEDNCPNISNENQLDYDGDGIGDVCDNDGDNDGVTEDIDNCEFGNIGWTSSSATDHDGDGCNDETEDLDDDNDGIDDYMDDCIKSPLGYTSNPETDYDRDGCIDENEDLDDDSDLIFDIDDRCPFSPLGFISSAISDIDGDGCRDDGEDLDDDDDGFLDVDDRCPTIFGTSSLGKYVGCLDSDGDSWADEEDVYPDNYSQWADSDEDGFGDNLSGTFGDACPTIFGTSIIDRFGCRDTDGDGYSDPFLDYTVIEGADALPDDPTQWLDSDGDGFGDNFDGDNPDICPEIFGTSTMNQVLGCLDSDGDGWADSIDAFPEDGTQWIDSDNDGFGDLAIGNRGDACPSQIGTSTIDRFGCPDVDDDGWSDLNDAFAFDPERWSDLDQDGFPDQANLSDTDDCPNTHGTSTKDRIGCIDSDGDGVSDSADAYPNDPSRSFEAQFSNTVFLIGIVVFITAILGYLIVRKKGEENSPSQIDSTEGWFESESAVYAQPQPQSVQGPPIPSEGLPPGWTLEQWNYYGHQYLDNK